MEIKNYRPIKKGTLDGYLDIHIPQMDWTIMGCGLFISGNKKWVNPPSRQYKDQEGKLCYSDIITMSKEERNRFSAAALKAYERYQPQADPEPIPDF